MRNKLYVVAVAALAVFLLAGCGPAARVLQSSSAINAGQTLPSAPAGSGGQNGPVAQINPATPAVPAINPGTRTLTVTGTGKTTLAPDLAYVTVGVYSENASVADAMAGNKALTQQVVDGLKAQGVDPKDIQTNNFSVYQTQSQKPGAATDGSSTVYAVNNTVFVTVRDLNKLGALLDAAVKNGANNIQGIQFDVADKTAALSSARKDAVKDAGDLANELASASGVKLGQILSISVNTVSGPVPMYSAYGMGGGGMAAAPATVPVSEGQLILTEDVTVVYEIQ